MVAFKVTTLVFYIILFALTIVNVIYYQNASQGNCTNVSIGFATFMMWVNIIILVILIGMFVWGLIKLFTRKPKKPQPGQPQPAPGQPMVVMRSQQGYPPQGYSQGVPPQSFRPQNVQQQQALSNEVANVVNLS